MKRVLFVVAFSLVTLPAALAQDPCPCVPLSHQWVVEACETWNCAAAATVLANGDKYVLALPTGSDDFKWIVVRRVVSGSYIAPADAPYQIETFDAAAAAMSRFGAVDQQLQPMLLTGADGKFLIVARSATGPAAKQRAAGH